MKGRYMRKEYNQNIGFRASDEEKLLFKKLAHRKEMTLSQLIKNILYEECQKENLSLDDVKKK